jgi:tRNA threonylcarbamoyl adenosine modification protein (Sua5/YciO/YrdC/YwlC family)
MIKKIENLLNLTKNDLQVIIEASNILKKDGIVAFPTETVYGIGALISSEKAIDKVYKVKNRPKDNPLIAHICSKEMGYRFIHFNNPLEKILFDFFANKFWPGPLSLIFKKNKNVQGFATCGLDTISLRMPDNKVALKLIEISDEAILAPSANISGKPSCTNAEEVFTDFGENIDLILDGGNTPIGIESTVIDIRFDKKIIEILRPGYITYEDILNEFKNFEQYIDLFFDNNFDKNILSELKDIFQSDKDLKSQIIDYFNSFKIVNWDYKNIIINDLSKVKSPGLKYKHYKPDAFVILIENREFYGNELKQKLIKKFIENLDKIINLNNTINNNKTNILNLKVLYISNDFKYFVESIFQEDDLKLNLKNIEFSIFQNGHYYVNNNINIEWIRFENEYDYAKNYYLIARKSDKEKTNCLILEGMEKKGFKLSLMNRLIKSADIIL